MITVIYHTRYVHHVSAVRILLVRSRNSAPLTATMANAENVVPLTNRFGPIIGYVPAAVGKIRPQSSTWFQGSGLNYQSQL